MNRLKEIRQNRGLSQFELGKAIDVYPQKISDFECGRRDLRLGEAVKIANALKVSVNELIENEVVLASSGNNASGKST